ncbi:MAG TPA: hypothetical protein VFW62_05365, partial [bacterium]|nr:hypothetical protein [bacterium]
ATVYLALAKQKTGDSEFDAALRTRAKEKYADLMGEGGAGANQTAIAITEVLCLGGSLCKPTEPRDWSDATEMVKRNCSGDHPGVFEGVDHGVSPHDVEFIHPQENRNEQYIANSEVRQLVRISTGLAERELDRGDRR